MTSLPMAGRRLIGRVSLALLLLPAAAAAQAGSPPGSPPVTPVRQTLPPAAQRGGARGGGARGGAELDDPRRAALERRFQERLVAIVKQRLSLSDEQAVRLRDVASKTEDERRALRRDELTARFAMRQELLAGDKADEQKVAELLEAMPKLERRRVELMEREQRELAKFLSPTQRARYFGLQDELRRGMQELQQRRLAAPDSAEPAPLRPGAGGALRRNRLRPPPR